MAKYTKEDRVIETSDPREGVQLRANGWAQEAKAKKAAPAKKAAAAPAKKTDDDTTK